MTSGAELLQEIFDVRGRRIVVTGAASGIGRAIAEVLAGAGAHVTLADRDASAMGACAAELRDAGLAVREFVVDITDEAALEELFDAVTAELGGVDVVFANAGGSVRGPRAAPGERSIDRYPGDAFARGISLNLFGAYATLRAAAGAMRGSGGRIILTASTAGLRPDPFVSYDYVAAKAAVVNLVRQAALDLAAYDIRVNAIAPGPFKTNIGGERGRDPEVVARWAATVPLGRMGETHELRGIALLLASEASSFMTGAVYPVDGGALALSELN